MFLYENIAFVACLFSVLVINMCYHTLVIRDKKPSLKRAVLFLIGWIVVGVVIYKLFEVTQITDGDPVAWAVVLSFFIVGGSPILNELLSELADRFRDKDKGV